MKKLLILVPFIILVAYFIWPEKTITYPAGITAPEQPVQNNLSITKEWQKDGYTIKALAEYKIKARVLSRNNFSIGRESDLSPLDLALGWGPMSDQSVIDKIKITQSNRWYHWETDSSPIPLNQVSLNSANVHIIPNNEDVENKLENVYKGSLIEMKGYLVSINAKDGWHWQSSLKRDDTGGGSCELFLVDTLENFDEN
ncbi:MAG TPA: hypothetical protein PKD67_01960 [Ignavibacteriaceae bacterium]|nr:hypothetical protein [Ignavibacteriaceae bacterium]